MLETGFLDEMIIAIHPLILGDGIPLFLNSNNINKTLHLRNIKTYDSGLLQVYYDVQSTIYKRFL
ncbi:hypothetical protein [Sphaerospermopsis reniformis]|uniref:hypothetical protein n=1 Tax=Sphaerospermopsis reniformis TaxID=531300 RepID=UPI0010F83CF7|nr:hypothetical protein [Sphaerospermopsis reniformis]